MGESWTCRPLRDLKCSLDWDDYDHFFEWAYTMLFWIRRASFFFINTLRVCFILWNTSKLFPPIWYIIKFGKAWICIMFIALRTSSFPVHCILWINKWINKWISDLEVHHCAGMTSRFSRRTSNKQSVKMMKRNYYIHMAKLRRITCSNER